MDEARLQILWDHHEIRTLLATYCHGCDRADAERMAAAYADESWDDHGPDKGTGRDFSHAMTARILRNVQCCSHQLGQSLIDLRGDEAGAETYFVATLRDRLADGGERLRQLGGRYVDMLVREANGWKIRHRTCVRDWSVTTPIAEDWLRDAGYVEGRLDGMDPSFAALGVQHSGAPGRGLR